jgi:hypothetical protein
VAWRVANVKALEQKEDEEKKENDAVKVKAQVRPSSSALFSRPCRGPCRFRTQSCRCILYAVARLH